MKKLASLVTILTLSSTPAFATQVKVIKTGGNRAVIEYPKGTVIKAGETLTLGSGDSMEEGGDASSGSAGARGNYISLESASALSLEEGGGFGFSLDVGYGWNLGSFEIAPSFSILKTPGADLGFGVGLDADINFSKNTPGASFVPAFTLGVGFNRESGANLIPISAGLAGKIFVLGKSTTAIRLEISFDMTKVPGAFVKSLTILGVGLQHYF